LRDQVWKSSNIFAYKYWSSTHTKMRAILKEKYKKKKGENLTLNLKNPNTAALPHPLPLIFPHRPPHPKQQPPGWKLSSPHSRLIIHPSQAHTISPPAKTSSADHSTTFLSAAPLLSPCHFESPASPLHKQQQPTPPLHRPRSPHFTNRKKPPCQHRRLPLRGIFFLLRSPSTPASTKPHSRTASSPPTRERAGPFSIASDPRSPSSAEQRSPHRQPAAPSTPGHRSTISQQRRPICHLEQRRRRWNP